MLDKRNNANVSDISVATEDKPVVFNVSVRADIIKKIISACLEEISDSEECIDETDDFDDMEDIDDFDDIEDIDDISYKYLVLEFYNNNEIVSKVLANVEDFSILIDAEYMNRKVFNDYLLDWESLWDIVENAFYHKDEPTVSEKINGFYSFHDNSEHLIVTKPVRRGRPSYKSMSKFDKLEIYYSN